MATPISRVAIFLTAWILILATTYSPMFSNDGDVNAALLTLVIPNVLFFIIDRLVLKSDAGYFLVSTGIAAGWTFMIKEIGGEKIKDKFKNYGKDRKSSLEVMGIVLSGFLLGGILSYKFVDDSIYDHWYKKAVVYEQNSKTY